MLFYIALVALSICTACIEAQPTSPYGEQRQCQSPTLFSIVMDTSTEVQKIAHQLNEHIAQASKVHQNGKCILNFVCASKQLIYVR